VTSQPPSPENGESSICLGCGFCCDGTLFHTAKAGSGDTRESFIAIGLTPVNGEAGTEGGFQLPCPVFTGSCSVYDSAQPGVCKAFRCRLLRSVERGKYTVAEAQQIVRETKALRDSLLPGFEAMYADAVVAGGSEAVIPNMLGRLGTIMSLLFRPDAAEFRAKYGKRLLTVCHLTSRLTNEFRPKSPKGMSGASQAQGSESKG
jgi:hypothetical protein